MRDVIVFDPENLPANGLEHGLTNEKNHALVGLSFKDHFARRETEKRPSNFLFSSEGRRLKKIRESTSYLR